MSIGHARRRLDCLRSWGRPSLDGWTNGPQTDRVDPVTPLTADQLHDHGATPHRVNDLRLRFPDRHQELQRPSVCAPREHERCS